MDADGALLRFADNPVMRRIEVKQLDYDLTPVGGLALVGHYLKALGPQWRALDGALPVRSGVSNSDVLRSYVGLLVQGKSDFDAVENYRGDKFFKESLGIGLLPSSPTLRQRLDAQAGALFEHVPGMIERLLSSQRPDYGVLPCGWLPLDVDTFAMDNGGTRKEGVGRTYAGVDGYCPLAAYLGAHGFCLELALRPGVQHSARETDFNLERVIPMAQRLSAGGPKAPILARLDSGFDSAALMRSIEACNQPGQPQVDWLIKWNPRGVDTAALLARLDADPGTLWHKPRQGKRVAVWEQAIHIEGIGRPLRRVLRLASGQFETNYLVCQLAALAMDILRLMGQRGLLGPDAPVRHPAKRRRIKTVMQELIYRAGRLIAHGRKLVLGLGANDRAARAFARLDGELFAASS